MPVEGLRLTDIVASAKEGLRAYNALGLELQNVRIDPEGGVPFLIRDSGRWIWTAFRRASQKPGTPVVRLDRVTGVTLRNSVAWPGPRRS